MPGRLFGKTAIVTGSAGGIGSAVCERFRAEGAEVLAADLAEAGLSGEARFHAADVTDESSVQRLIDAASREWGSLDILVNAAGIEIEETIETTTLEAWNKIFAVNVTGVFLMCRTALGLLRKSGGGAIINFGSYDGFIADPRLAAYCATKGAVHALTRAMACDHGPEGIRVNAICPGYVETPMLKKFFGGQEIAGETRRAAEDVHPLRRIGQPQDMAGLAVYLASDEARYASGQLWVLDGGLTAQAQQMRI